MYALVLIGLGLCFLKDKNFLSILIIILFNHTSPDIIYYIGSLQAHVIVKSLIYASSAYTFFKLRYDNLAKFAQALLSCIVIAEIYWWLTGYDRVPLIAYYVAGVVANIIARHLILKRSRIFNFWSQKIKQTPVDWHLYHLIGLAVPLIAVCVIEFFFRHILNIQSLIIYNIYSELMYLINTVVLWILLNYAMRKTALFQA